MAFNVLTAIKGLQFIFIFLEGASEKTAILQNRDSIYDLTSHGLETLVMNITYSFLLF